MRVELPATGSGPLHVHLTGADGLGTHLEQARAFSGEGSVVAIVDGSQALQDLTSDFRGRVKQALGRSEVRSPQAVLVGYSRGGWLVLVHGRRMPELVAAAVAFYPSTSAVFNPKAFLTNPAVPVPVPTLVLADVRDNYVDGCLIERARWRLRLRSN